MQGVVVLPGQGSSPEVLSFPGACVAPWQLCCHRDSTSHMIPSVHCRNTAGLENSETGNKNGQKWEGFALGPGFVLSR